MRKNLKVFICLIFILTGASKFVYSQNGKGHVFIAIDPSNSIIRIDTMLLQKQQRNLTLDTGTYVIKAWATGRHLLVDTLVVSDSKYSLYRKKLSPTPEYLDYKQKYNKYKTVKYIPLAIIGASAIYFGVQNINYKIKAEDNLDQSRIHKEKYEAATDPITIAEERSQYEDARKDYESAIEKRNNHNKAALIILPTEIVATGLFFIFSDALVKPIFKETPLLSDLSFNYKFIGNDTGLRVSYSKKF